VRKEIPQSIKPWFWFAQDIDIYMSNIIYTAEAAAEILSAVKMVYEPNDKSKLKAVLKKCNFERDFAQIDIESCIEY
jgi:hypothetical protein